MGERIKLPSGVSLRDFHDSDALREDILERVRNAYLAKFPLENDAVRIELLDAAYDEKKKKFSLQDFKKSLLEGGTLATPLHGNFRLIDKATGGVIEEKKALIANVPNISHRGTFVSKGTEFLNTGQQRLRPGVYARKKESGEIESHLNVRPGTGPQMRLYMEPETGVYRINLQKANIKLYPVLHATGVTDEQLEKTWGPEVLKANQLAWDKQAVDKFYSKMFGAKADMALPLDQKGKLIAEKFGAMEVDPVVTGRTMSKPYDRLTPEAIVDASHKLLRMNRGEVEEDDRDSLANKYFMSTDDFMEERVKKDAGQLGRQLLYKTGYDRTLKALSPGYFSPQLQGLIVGNSLSAPTTGINTMQLRDEMRRVVVTGDGGIGDPSAIPLKSRGVHASQLGFIDPIRSAESGSIGVDLRFSAGAKKGSDGQIYSQFRNKKTGELEWMSPSDLAGKTVGFPPNPEFGMELPANNSL